MISELSVAGLVNLDRRFSANYDKHKKSEPTINFKVDNANNYLVGGVTSYNAVAIAINPKFTFFGELYNQTCHILKQINSLVLFYFSPWLTQSAFEHIQSYQQECSFVDINFSTIKSKGVHFNQFCILKKLDNKILFTPSSYITTSKKRFIIRQTKKVFIYELELIIEQSEHIKFTFDVRYLNNSFKKLSQLLYSKTFEPFLNISFEKFVSNYKKEDIDLLKMLII